MKAFYVTCSWFPNTEGVLFAATSSKARMEAARSLADAWNCTIGEALKVLRVVRAPSYDRHEARFEAGKNWCKDVVDRIIEHADARA